MSNVICPHLFFCSECIKVYIKKKNTCLKAAILPLSHSEEWVLGYWSRIREKYSVSFVVFLPSSGIWINHTGHTSTDILYEGCIGIGFSIDSVVWQELSCSAWLMLATVRKAQVQQNHPYQNYTLIFSSLFIIPEEFMSPYISSVNHPRQNLVFSLFRGPETKDFKVPTWSRWAQLKSSNWLFYLPAQKP